MHDWDPQPSVSFCRKLGKDFSLFRQWKCGNHVQWNPFKSLSKMNWSSFRGGVRADEKCIFFCWVWIINRYTHESLILPRTIVLIIFSSTESVARTIAFIFIMLHHKRMMHLQVSKSKIIFMVSHQNDGFKRCPMCAIFNMLCLTTIKANQNTTR